MAKPRFKFANLDEESLSRIQMMEEEMDSYILALEPRVELATLTEEQIAKLQTLEEELGVVLLAYRQDQ